MRAAIAARRAGEPGVPAGGGDEAPADDSVVSPDDEDIEESGEVGQPVIESVLGGTVFGELEQ